VSFSTTSASWSQVESRSGCSKIDRTNAATIGHAALVTLVAKFAMK
jgi:hypothetical protein